MKQGRLSKELNLEGKNHLKNREGFPKNDYFKVNRDK